MIKLEGVSFAYGDYPTVRDVSYELKDHQITTLYKNEEYAQIAKGNQLYLNY